jgi:hypothetical protein
MKKVRDFEKALSSCTDTYLLTVFAQYLFARDYLYITPGKGTIYTQSEINGIINNCRINLLNEFGNAKYSPAELQQQMRGSGDFDEIEVDILTGLSASAVAVFQACIELNKALFFDRDYDFWAKHTRDYIDTSKKRIIPKIYDNQANLGEILSLTMLSIGFATEIFTKSKYFMEYGYPTHFSLASGLFQSTFAKFGEYETL